MIADSMTYGVNPPLQERSQHTLDRIVSAAESLIREKGLDGTSISEIVSRAEVSVGSFYARFRGKESLLQCLLGRATDLHRRNGSTVDCAPRKMEGRSSGSVRKEGTGGYLLSGSSPAGPRVLP